MSITNLYPLCFLALIPVIIILYMLKQKAKDYKFSSLIFWQEIYKNIEATKPFEKFKRNLLMFLQILIIILIVFAMTSPYLKNGKEFENVIILIDNSASMNVLYNKEETRFNSAIKEAVKYIDSLKNGTNISIISGNSNAKMELTNSTDKENAKKILKDLKSTDLSGNLNNAKSLVNALKNNVENCELIYFSDNKVNFGDISTKFVDFYSNIDNIAIDKLTSLNANNNLLVLIKISNQGIEEKEVEINLYGDDKLLEIKNITLKANETVDVYFENVDFNGEILRAEINDNDDLLKDNVAYNILNNSKTKKILLLTNSNTFLEKAIIGSENIELYKSNDIENLTEDMDYDLYIIDNMNLDKVPDGNLLYFNSDSNEIFNIEKTEENVMLKVLKSDITRYLENYTFGIGEVKLMKKPIWAESFIDYDEYSAGFYGEYEGKKIGIVGFDIHNSDFPLQSQFPIFISNLIEYLIESSLVEKTSYETGEKINLYPKMNGSELKIEHNEEVEKLELKDYQNVYQNTDYSGLYKVSQTVDNVENVSYFVINYPKDEILIEDNNQNSTNLSDNVENNGVTSLKMYVILLCLLVVLVEWIIYIKKQ